MQAFVLRRCLLGVIATWAIGCSAEGAGFDDLTNNVTTGGTGATYSGGAGGMSASGGAGGILPGTGGAGGIVSNTGGMGGGAAGMSGGVGGMGSSGGMGGAGGMASGGMGGMASGGMGGMASGGMGGMGSGGMGGDAGDDGGCLCLTDPPSALTNDNGPYDVDTFELPSGTVYYPTDAEGPLGAVAIVPGFLNSGPEMAAWGPFYASWGIVTNTAYTIGSDIPDIRAIKLLAAIDELKAENTKSGSPLFGKLAGRYGTSGYSMGGGGTTIATTSDNTLKTSIGLAAWGPVGSGITTPTLFLCGDSDSVAPCFGSQSAYDAIPTSTPKMIQTISGATHFSWFGPDDAGRGASGARALAFQKVYLEGDERWLDILLTDPASGSMETNITP